MTTTNYSHLQAQQWRKFWGWVKTEGGLEWPTRIDTLLSERQQARLSWLKENAWGSILEVGCNWGFVLAAVGGHYGVDIHEVNVELARLLAPGRDFRVADATDLPFGEKEFTTVMVPETLEHLDWPDGVYTAVQEAKRVASHRVLITVPDARTPTEDALSFKHAWLLTEQYIEEMLGWLPGGTVEFRQGFALFRWDRGA